MKLILVDTIIKNSKLLTIYTLELQKDKDENAHRYAVKGKKERYREMKREGKRVRERKIEKETERKKNKT